MLGVYRVWRLHRAPCERLHGPFRVGRRPGRRALRGAGPTRAVRCPFAKLRPLVLRGHPWWAHTEQRGTGLWDEVCSPKMQWWSLLALADLFVINRPHTQRYHAQRARRTPLKAPEDRQPYEIPQGFSGSEARDPSSPGRLNTVSSVMVNTCETSHGRNSRHGLSTRSRHRALEDGPGVCGPAPDRFVLHAW